MHHEFCESIILYQWEIDRLNILVIISITLLVSKLSALTDLTMLLHEVHLGKHNHNLVSVQV